MLNPVGYLRNKVKFTIVHHNNGKEEITENTDGMDEEAVEKILEHRASDSGFSRRQPARSDDKAKHEKARTPTEQAQPKMLPMLK